MAILCLGEDVTWSRGRDEVAALTLSLPQASIRYRIFAVIRSRPYLMSALAILLETTPSPSHQPPFFFHPLITHYGCRYDRYHVDSAELMLLLSDGGSLSAI